MKIFEIGTHCETEHILKKSCFVCLHHLLATQFKLYTATLIDEKSN